MTGSLIIFAPVRPCREGESWRGPPCPTRPSVGRDDTHNRHQHAWTLLHSTGPRRAPHARPWTPPDIVAMLCKQGSGVRVPLAPPAETSQRSWSRPRRAVSVLEGHGSYGLSASGRPSGL